MNMKTAGFKWNEKVANLNFKSNKLREVSKHKKVSTEEPCIVNGKNLYLPTSKNDAKKREFPIIKNEEVVKNVYKRTNGGCSLKDKNLENVVHRNSCGKEIVTSSNTNSKNRQMTINSLLNKSININKCANGNTRKIVTRQNTQNNKIQNNSNVVNANMVSRIFLKSSNESTNANTNGNKTRTFYLPISKTGTNKVAKTKSNNFIEYNNTSVLSGKDKKKTEKNKKCNEKKWIIATKHVKTDALNKNQNKTQDDTRKKKYVLYFEGEDGKLQVYPVHADGDVGFHNVSHLDDEFLSQIKKENQDDDDIKTTKRLAEWSSELVYKYLEESIYFSKNYFRLSDVANREKEIMMRMAEQ